MPNRNYPIHTISSTAPKNVQVGDEYYSPTTNLLYKAVAVGGRTITNKQLMIAETNGNLIVPGAITSTGTMLVNGEIRATNNITAYYSSDSKFKENIRPIPNALDKVLAIGGKMYDWTDEYVKTHGGLDDYFVQKEDFGVIAQDVLQVFPQAIRVRPDGSLAVDYVKLSALAFQAISELHAEIEELKKKLP